MDGTEACELATEASRLNQDRPWGPWATIGFTLVLVVAMVAVQLAVAIGFFAAMLARDPSMAPDAAAANLSSNGLLLALATIVSTPVVVGLAVLFIWLRRGVRVRDYLALRWVGAGPMLACLALAGVCVVVADGLSIALGRPVVPDFMLSTYRTAGFVPLFWIALCCFAPAGEELVFRGFMFAGLSRSRLGASGAIVLSSLAWTSLHVQYGLYELSQVFVLGLILGAIRATTGSVIPAIVMHMTLNLVATIETAVAVAR